MNTRLFSPPKSLTPFTKHTRANNDRHFGTKPQFQSWSSRNLFSELETLRFVLKLPTQYVHWDSEVAEAFEATFFLLIIVNIGQCEGRGALSSFGNALTILRVFVFNEIFCLFSRCCMFICSFTITYQICEHFIEIETTPFKNGLSDPKLIMITMKNSNKKNKLINNTHLAFLIRTSIIFTEKVFLFLYSHYTC